MFLRLFQVSAKSDSRKVLYKTLLDKFKPITICRLIYYVRKPIPQFKFG